MGKVYVFMAHGFEEMELTITVDMLRRAEFDVQTVSLADDTAPVTGSRGIPMVPDITFKQLQEGLADWLVLPGGIEGTKRLAEDARVLALIKRHVAGGKRVAAICAAPTVLVRAGVAGGWRMTSHPGMREKMEGVEYLEDRVVADGPFITSRAAGTTFDFAAAIIAAEKGHPAFARVNAGVLAAV
ncbi:DJ-1/PfpI family protein [Candidatus Ozemobacteraceae bacterium]|nr:DJ-1/PfpI family protein [Candidatus Ozemobacteraceae bacterium]